MPNTLPTASDLSVEFCRILNDWLDAETIARINRLNKSSEYQGCCATHDFCDPNQAMVDALENFGMPFHPELCDLINDAWDLARARGFQISAQR